MKRWMALFTIAMWVAGVAVPPMVDAAGVAVQASRTRRTGR
mgnify:CR=1 FL=1